MHQSYYCLTFCFTATLQCSFKLLVTKGCVRFSLNLEGYGEGEKILCMQCLGSKEKCSMGKRTWAKPGHVQQEERGILKLLARKLQISANRSVCNSWNPCSSPTLQGSVEISRQSSPSSFDANTSFFLKWAVSM